MSQSQITRASTLWQPGVSGNPGGRPRANRKVIELARQHTEAAIAALAEALQATRHIPVGKDATIEVPDHPTRIHAAIALRDSGWGKPASSEIVARMMEDSDEGTAADGLSDDQAARIYAILKEGQNA